MGIEFRSLLDFFFSASGVGALLEIFLIYLGIYYFIRFCEGTRGAGILKGLALFITVATISLKIGSNAFGLTRLQGLLNWIGAASTTALVILLQPELRRGLTRLSQSQIFGEFLREDEDVIDEILHAVYRLAKNRVGGLIAIEREDSLHNYMPRESSIDAEVKSSLITTIFYPGTELHDGAIVIRRGRIAAAGSLFPLSENPQLGSWAGTRHRAAVGLSESTDAIVVVVSEERGEVSLCVRGEIERDLDRTELEERLRAYYAMKEAPQPETTEVT